MSEKEIWYVWDGGSKLPEGVKALVDENGFSMDARKGDNHAYAVAHCCAYNGSGIVTYTLGETRERVVCSECISGYIPRIGIGISICNNCKGAGHIWKLGEKK